jgi:hypothetical protein
MPALPRLFIDRHRRTNERAVKGENKMMSL